jgi:hypothetical protein
MHKTIVTTAAALLTGAGACLAQPPGSTMFVGKVGKPCGLCTHSNWDVRSKGIKE